MPIKSLRERFFFTYLPQVKWRNFDVKWDFNFSSSCRIFIKICIFALIFISVVPMFLKIFIFLALRTNMPYVFALSYFHIIYTSADSNHTFKYICAKYNVYKSECGNWLYHSFCALYVAQSPSVYFKQKIIIIFQMKNLPKVKYFP